MKKIVPIFFFICLQIFGLKAQTSQPVFVKIITNETATTVTADVIIFTKDSISGFQFPILWDSSVVNKPMINSFLGTASTAFGSTAIGADINGGFMKVFWYAQNGFGFPLNGMTLINYTFDKKKNGNHKIRLAEKPIIVEFVGTNLQILPYVLVDALENPYPIKGKILADLNLNCQANTSDVPLANTLVKAYNPSEGYYYAYTDTSGNYSIYTSRPNLPYTLSAVPNDTSQWSPCVKSVIVTPQIDSSKQFDFLLKPSKICHESVVKVSIPFLRRCFSNTYTVNYQNTGTLPLQNAHVVLTLDKDLAMESVTSPFTSLGNNQYKVSLGNLPIGSFGTFYFTAKLSCTGTILGQTHCVEAQFFPENDCNNDQGKFQITPTCANGKVNFTIENKDLIASKDINYVIIEDDMIFKQGKIPTFSPSQTLDFDVPANGAVWRMEILKNNQVVAANFYEACGTNTLGKFSTGFPMQYSLPTPQTNVSKNCQQSIGAYDPNDKQGFPLGVKDKHFIDQNVPIEYLIRFQNTGTDTAFNIIVEDRIDDALLDLSKLRIVASSHKMTWSIKNKNTLVFDFKSIMLPDSFKSKILSNGFIRFSINQKRNNTLQSVVKNKANIYFDFNDAVITNETFHTIGKDFLSVAQTIFVPDVSVVLKPNPFSTDATMDIIGNVNGKLHLEIYDLFGRKIEQKTSENSQFYLNKEQYQEGFYLYSIYKEGLLIANGKFLVN